MTFALGGCSHKSHRATAVGATSSPLTSQRASTLSSELTAGSDAALRDAVAIPSGEALDPNAARQIAALAPITFDPASFHQVDGQNAMVDGTVSHPAKGQSSKWTFQLTYAGGSWRLVDGHPQS
ncbi:MAG: hypothetical protein M3Y77_17365 [Actinomycetota bacterium]|nr:hypothetical protein [Actinomycetota bacterium]MDQ2848074.1 hypothetical protein [Actinomycetota bacterium]